MTSVFLVIIIQSISSYIFQEAAYSEVAFFVGILLLRGGEDMKKLIINLTVLLGFLMIASPVFAQSADVSKIQTFIQSLIQILTTIAGLVAAGFFVWGGFGYITSSGNPESLDRSKKTIVYSGVGLAIVFGAFVLSNVVTQLATSAFGK